MILERMKKRTIIFLLFSMILLACSDCKKSAKHYLQQAQTAYDSHKYEKAKSMIDSIKIIFPKAFNEIQAGFDLMQKIRMAENKRNIFFCDSLMAIKINKIEKLKTKFDYVRDTRYEEFGQYVSKSYSLSVSEKQNTLRAAVTEKGNLYLESVLIGKFVKHTRVKVSAHNGHFAETSDVTADGLNYQFNTLNNRHEIVRYITQNQNNMAEFIYTYQHEPLTLTFIGTRSFSVVLSQRAKKSIAQSFELSRLQNDIKTLEFEKEKSEVLIRYLKSKTDKYND